MKELILNTSFPSLNEYINAERSNRHIAANLKKIYTNKVAYLAKEQKFKLEPGVYDVKFIWYKPDNRKDHDNIAFAKKFIFDGIVKAKSLKGDNPKHVWNLSDEFILDKTRDYISCKVIFDKRPETID